MSRISVPTTAPLPSSLRVNPSSTTVTKILSRLSRASLISVALDWLDEDNLSLATPYLRPDQDDDEEEDDGDFYPPASSPEELREEYLSLQNRKGSKRDVLDRITTGDWRHGVSLYQLAIADLQYLYDHPTSQKWSAYNIVPLKAPTEDDDGEVQPLEADKTSLTIPRFHPSLFLKSLQAQILPDIKAHYNLDRHKTLPLLILRIFVIDSPYNTPLSLSSNGNMDTSSKTILIAFPDGSPNIFISKPTSTGPTGASESKSLRALLVEGIPKALSLPRQRVTLQSTSLTTRNLEGLLDRRGATRGNAAGGGWSIYADEKVKESPLSTVLPSPPLSDAAEEEEQGNGDKKRRERPTVEERVNKRAKLVAQARFGDTARVGDGKGVERVDLVMEDPFEIGGDDADRMDIEGEDDGEEAFRPNVRLTFHGSHVFAGIRQLVECGVIDGEKMPGWMTGEEGVTIGAVRNGRIRGHKGSGL